MPPTFQESPRGSSNLTVLTVPRPPVGEEVVISGISGIFPSSKNVKEFMYNLYNKVDMVSYEYENRDFNHLELPDHLVAEDIDKIDQIFEANHKQLISLEPTCRKILELAYCAVSDAGVNPTELRGKKVGVFIGASISESEKVAQYEAFQIDGFNIIGTNKSIFANQISYWLDVKGPSYDIDADCASSMICIEQAYKSILSGRCEAAIVGGCNLCSQHSNELHMNRDDFLCSDGKTKCFDKNGDGYMRTNAVNVLFLQKTKDAKRIYTEIYHAKVNYSIQMDAFSWTRQAHTVKDFLHEFYEEVDVPPQEVEFIEAHASGIAEADRNELQAIGLVYCKDKLNNPVLVGSVKSNMGNSEPAAGVCSVTKMCLAYQKRELPANLHYKDPHDLDEVHDGRIQIVTKNTPFRRGYAALNSFSYTGANVHILLKGHYKEKDIECYRSSIPYLISISGREKDFVTNLLKVIQSIPTIGLLHNIHQSDIVGHTYISWLYYCHKIIIKFQEGLC